LLKPEKYQKRLDRVFVILEKLLNVGTTLEETGIPTAQDESLDVKMEENEEKSVSSTNPPDNQSNKQDLNPKVNGNMNSFIINRMTQKWIWEMNNYYSCNLLLNYVLQYIIQSFVTPMSISIYQ
jgi:hypothetical protein